MLTSITPLGERGRQRRWGVTVTAYAVSSTTAGATLGALLGLLPDLPPAVFAIACLVAAAADLRPGALPTVKRQVNEDWLHAYRGWVYGVGFGAQLGLGVVTIVTTAAVYATVLAAALGSPAYGALVGATFGFVRAAPALLTARVTTTARLVALSRRIERWATPARHATIGALALAGLAAFA